MCDGVEERVSIHRQPHRMQEEGSSASLKESVKAIRFREELFNVKRSLDIARRSPEKN